MSTRDDLIERAADAVEEAACRCGHKFAIHDPEDGFCDSFASVTIGQCRCRAFASPDPNQTRGEWLAAAVIDALGIENVSYSPPRFRIRALESLTWTPPRIIETVDFCDEPSPG